MALPTTSCSHAEQNSFSKLLSLPTATNLPRALGDHHYSYYYYCIYYISRIKQIISVALAIITKINNWVDTQKNWNCQGYICWVQNQQRAPKLTLETFIMAACQSQGTAYITIRAYKAWWYTLDPLWKAQHLTSVSKVKYDTKNFPNLYLMVKTKKKLH